jgi:hypothetical protein
MYQVFGGGAGTTVFLHADNIATNSLTANEIYGNTLSVIAADMGLLTAGEIRMIGAAGSITLDSTGIKLFDGVNPAADNIRLWLNTADGKFTFKSAVAGNARIEIDNTQIVGYDGADVKQFYLSATDGVAYAGGGSVRLNAGGLQIISDAPVAPTEQLRFLYDDAGTERLLGQAYSDWAGGANPAVTWLTSRRKAGDPWPVNNRLVLAAIDTIAGTDVRLTLYSSGYGTLSSADLYCQQDVRVTNDIRVGGGLVVGNTALNPAIGYARVDKGLYVGDATKEADNDDIWCDGEISTDGGTNRWELIDWHATGDFIANGYIDIKINGVPKRLLTRV